MWWARAPIFSRRPKRRELSVRRFIAGLIVSGIAAAMLGACGSSDSKPVARADYVKRADAICKKYNAKTKKLSAPKSAAELKPYIHSGVQLVLASVGELRALPKSDTDADKFASLYDAVEQRYKDLDSKSSAELEKLPSSFLDDLNSRATKLGLKECGQG